MKGITRFILASICGLAFLATSADAQQAGRYGVRVGTGTDISGGIAFGGQLGYTLFQGDNAAEFGLLVFGGRFEEKSNNGFHDYFETTDLLVAASVANYLIRYSMALGGPYLLAGAGAGAISVSWREESPTDTSLGGPLPGGGSFQEEDGTVGGAILSLGIGHRFSERFDLRVQVPTFFIPGGERRDGAVVPTLTVTLGIAF